MPPRRKLKIASLAFVIILAWPGYYRARTVFIDAGAFRPPLSPDLTHDTEDFVKVTQKLASELTNHPHGRWFVMHWSVLDSGVSLDAEARYDRSAGTLALWTEKHQPSGKTEPWRPIGNYKDVTDSMIQAAASHSLSLRQLQGFGSHTVITVPRED